MAVGDVDIDAVFENSTVTLAVEEIVEVTVTFDVRVADDEVLSLN